MKKILIPSFIACYLGFVFVVFQIKKEISHRMFQDYQDKMYDLQGEGYSYWAANHIAMVESGYIEADAEYTALIED